MTDASPSHMRLVIDVAKKCAPEDGRLHPKVGALLVKGTGVLGSAYRGELEAGDHAEFTLFEKKLRAVDLVGTTLFTTLEPCTARGSHKPCTQWTIEKGIAEVVIGMLDPNPRVYSQGARALRGSGIGVKYFPEELREEIRRDNAAFISQFSARPELNGKVTFNYTDNNGLYTIGHGEFLFETKWSKGSDVTIWTYNDPQSIDRVAIALDARDISDVCDAGVYDASSRARMVREGQYVVLKNKNGYWAAVHILDVKDRERSDTEDQLVFQYWILDDWTADFSKSKTRQ